jgi:hypothetical protein
MLGLCLARSAATLAIAASQFTLSWTHSIEKVRWEEQWRVTPAGLVVELALIHGSGAGMEPPDGAVLAGGVWRYRPKLPPQPTVTLAASSFTADHTLCVGDDCRALQRWIAGSGPVRLSPCEVAARAP